MANISIKKDFEDGQKLFAQQLNNNFETIELGINAGNKLIWKDDNGAEFQTFRGTTEEIENRPIIDGQTLYNIETGEMLLDTEGARRTINKPLWNDNSTSEVTSFRGTTEEIENRPIIDGQKLYDIENGDTFLDVGETRKVMNKPLWKDDNGAQVQSFRGTAAEVAARPIIDGQTLYNIETGETALDVGNKRISTGAGNVVYIGDEEPQNDATKIWIENNQVLNLGSEVAISAEEPTTQEKVWIQRGKNLYNESQYPLTYNRALNPEDGATYSTSSGNYYATECYVPIDGANISKITFSSNVTISFYTSNKTFISGGGDKQTYDVPSNARYLRFDIHKNNINNIQIEQGEVATSYEPYITKKIHTNTGNGYEEFYNEANIEVYSTGETRIGTYLGKPLYRKVIKFALIGTYEESGLRFTFVNNALGGPGIVDEMPRLDGTYRRDGGDRIYALNNGLTLTSSQVHGTMSYRLESNGAPVDMFQVAIPTTIESSQKPVATLIVEYTKTTD